jgi:hypothetical protein
MVAEFVGIGAGREQQQDQFQPSGSSSLMQWRVPTHLCRIQIRSLVNQEAHRFLISAQRNARVQRLVAHGVARVPVDMRSMLQQQSRRLGTSEGRSEMERSPPVNRGLMDPDSILFKQRLESLAIAHRGCLKNIQFRQAGQQKIAYRWLPAINGPQKCRDALGVSALDERLIFFDGGRDFCRFAFADEIKKTLAHQVIVGERRFLPYRPIST